MGRRVAIGVLLVVAGLAMFGVATWYLADKTYIGPGVPLPTGDSPKVGMAAAVFAIILGLCICFWAPLTEQEKKKVILLIAITVVLVFALATFGIAVKDRLDIKKLEDLENTLGGLNSGQPNFSGQGGRWKRQLNTRGGQISFDVLFGKIKKQLVAMAVASGIAAALEIIALILAFMLRPQQSSRNTMQMEKTY